MIKLNNKNITYVALADSNNSIKAPKEIWYADSSNSVKLVYRRKDALIEGEDYEKYHWLKGDSAARIINSYNVWQNKLEVEVGNIQNNQFSSNYNDTGVFLAVVYNSGGGNPYMLVAFREGGSNHIADIRYAEMPEKVVMTFFQENSIAYCNQNGILKVGDEITQSLWDKDVPVMIHSAKMSYIREVLPNDTYRSNLIPCKLLKPVPKWLDANGIRRQVGECGMIDIVSGKFYGNVNSVGTFTVENYYERKEWLVGDGTAYIDTLHLANEGLGWETHVSNLSFKKYFVWNRVVKSESPAIALYHSIATNGTVRIQNNYTNSIVLQNQTNYDYIVAINSNGAVINGVQYIGQLASENISNKSIKLFYCDINEESKIDTIIPNGGNSQDVKCSYFRFLDPNGNYIQNLIPCTLTMDLPASMDANNTPRTKGTSGMWDLVSDKFYGNVANSGTFKAVNLAEGVDYEVHQWLVGDGSAYINTNIKPSENLRTKIKFAYNDSSDSIARNSSIFGSGLIASGGVISNRYWVNCDTATSTASSYLEIGYGAYHQIGTSIDPTQNTEIDFNYIEANTHKFKINDTVYTRSGEPNTTQNIVIFGRNVSGTIYVSNSRVSYFQLIDSSNLIMNMIPCKLLKSIPAKYDANGIARNAGECGMYDTVNDVFYGNVASSGTFSVEDDE